MDHGVVLERLCRICARSVVYKSVHTEYPCSNHLEEIHTVFGLSVKLDDPAIHPTHFCHACKTVIHKHKCGGSYQHRTTVFEGWCTHTEDCPICEHYSGIQRGGRPKKVKKTPGRPPNINPRSCISHIQSVAPSPFLPSTETVTPCSVHLPGNICDFYCPICLDILSSPVQLVTCGSVVCAPCLSRWLQTRDSLTCPSCRPIPSLSERGVLLSKGGFYFQLKGCGLHMCHMNSCA